MLKKNKIIRILFFLLITMPYFAMATESKVDTQLVKKVYTRILSMVDANQIPNNAPWPPVLKFNHSDAINAHSYYYKGTLYISINDGLLKRITTNNPNYIAMLLGHELSHILLKHVFKKRKEIEHIKEKYGDIVQIVYSRNQEFSADSLGLILALRAGYNYNESIGLLKRMGELLGDYSSVESVSVDHPSFAERLANLDKRRAQYWRALASFTDAVYFLNIGEYEIATYILEDLTHIYPSCADCWANLGYAYLMKYLDHLDAKDFSKFNIGYLFLRGFYKQSSYLGFRGIDEDVWYEAVGALREALRLNPTLSLAAMNLGIAYLVAPYGKDVKNAEHYFAKAKEISNKDKSLTSYTRGILYSNLASYYLASENLKDYKLSIDEAENYIKDYHIFERVNLYNKLIFSLIPDQNKKTNKSMIYRKFEAFLKNEPFGSLWWNYIYEQYKTWCTNNSFSYKNKSYFQKKNISKNSIRRVVSLKIGNNKEVYIGQSLKAFLHQFSSSDYEIVPLVKGTNIIEIRFPKHHISVLATDRIFLIRSSCETGITFETANVGGEKFQISVGISKKVIFNKLTPYYEPFIINGNYYYYYPSIGVGFRFDHSKVIEIVINAAQALGNKLF